MTKIASKTTTKLPMCIMDMIDGFTNVPFSVVWFNQPFMQKKYKFCVGQSFFIYGKLQYDPTFGYRIMNPQYFDTDLQKYRRLIPIYKQRKGIAASTYSKALTEAFSEDLVEPLSDSFRKAHNLPLSKNMGQQLMAPKNEDSLKFAMQYFMLEDMLYFSGHLYRRNITDNTCKIPIMPKTDLQKKIIANLPYALTEGQVNVIASVGQKLAQGYQVFVGFNDGESLYAVTDIDDGESEALYIESESPSGNRSETMSEDFLDLLCEIDGDMKIKCYPARHIDEEIEEPMNMETVVKAVAIDSMNGNLILLAEVED